MTPTNIEELLKTSDIVRLTGRSRSSIRRERLMRTGIPFLRLGRSIRYQPESVGAYLKSREEGNR